MSQASNYTLYEDDGADADAIADNKFELITFRSLGLKRTTHITIQSNGGTFTGRPARRDIMITIPNLDSRPVSIWVDGKRVPVEESETASTGFTTFAAWIPATKTLRIPMPFTSKKVEAIVRF